MTSFDRDKSASLCNFEITFVVSNHDKVDEGNSLRNLYTETIKLSIINGFGKT